MASDAHGHGHDHVHAEGKGCTIVALGCLTVGGATFTIDREGQVAAGAETEFGVECIVGSAKAVPSAAWLANPDGTKVADPVTSEDHDAHWHFTVAPLDPVKKSKFVLKVGDEEATLDFCNFAQPCNDGILAVLKDKSTGEKCGYAELKLHGDAGDLELFLYSSSTNSSEWARKKPKPLDIAKETVVGIAFPTHPGKTVELNVRDMEKNEDEGGAPHMHGDATDYFIFPGETEQDPKWLIGETTTSWRGHAVITFTAGGKEVYTDPFVMVPHDCFYEAE